MPGHEFFIPAWHFRPRELSCFVERSWLHWFQGGDHVWRFAGKKRFLQNHHCFYQNVLLTLWWWMNVFDDSIKSNGGFECLSPKLELKVNVETSKVFALNGIE